MTTKFSVKSSLKSRQTQYSFRSEPADASPLFSVLPDLRDAVRDGKEWSLGVKSVVLSFNGTPMNNSATTLSYYPDAGYLEFNLNKGNALHNYVEGRHIPDRPIEFDAEFTPAANAGGVATINVTLSR